MYFYLLAESEATKSLELDMTRDIKIYKNRHNCCLEVMSSVHTMLGLKSITWQKSSDKFKRCKVVISSDKGLLAEN